MVEKIFRINLLFILSNNVYADTKTHTIFSSLSFAFSETDCKLPPFEEWQIIVNIIIIKYK